METLTIKELLLVMFALVSLFGMPLMFIDFISQCFEKDKALRFWWWKRKGEIGMKVWTVIEVAIPLLVGAHWLIVAIWFPNLYK